MNVDSILEKHALFLTGASGFIGTMILRKWLDLLSKKYGSDMTKMDASECKKIYVLLRKSAKYSNINQRLRDEVLKNEIFDAYHDNLDGILGSLLVAIEGDLTLDMLGVSDENRCLLRKESETEAGIFFLHCAADVQFDRPFNRAMDINVNGSFQCIRLAEDCHCASFLHISTLYTNSRENTEALISEQLYPQGFDRTKLFHSWVDNNKQMKKGDVAALQSKCGESHLGRGWPNTYTFTKNIAESVVIDECKQRRIPLSIARLGIVSPCYKGENAGWFMGSGGFVFVAIGAATGHLKYLYGDGTGRPDFVPVDYTVNAVMGISAELLSKKSGKAMIYQLGMAHSQGEDWDISKVFEFCTPRFHESSVPGTKPGACVVFVPNHRWFQLIELCLYDIPLGLMYPIEWIGTKYGELSNIFSANPQIKPKAPRWLKKMAFLRKARSKMVWFNANYEYFMNHRWQFDDTNTKGLFQTLDKTSKITYDFDSSAIDTNQYALDNAITVMKKWYAKRAQRKKEALKKQESPKSPDSSTTVDTRLIERRNWKWLVPKDILGVPFAGFGYRGVSVLSLILISLFLLSLIASFVFM